MRDIRLVIQQLSLRRYRIPVYQELAKREGIRLKVVYGTEGETGMVAPDGFDGVCEPARRIKVGRHVMLWHGAQWRYASRRKCDVLILSWDLHYILLLPSLIKAKLFGIPTVLWGHGYSKQEKGWRQWLRDRVARLAGAILLYNHTAAKQFIERGWKPDRVFVALNSLDQEPIQRARQYWLDHPDQLAQFRQENGLGDGPVALFVSRLLPENRLDLLLHAALTLGREFPDLRVVIVGTGPDEPRLKQLAQELGVADISRFTGAIFDEEQLAPWFLSASVLAYPTNMGLSVLHSFGYGLPVVTTNRPTAHGPEIESLETGYNGLLYADGDADQFTQTLAQIFRDPQLREQLSRNALETIKTRFNIQSMVDGMESAVRYACRMSRSTRTQ